MGGGYGHLQRAVLVSKVFSQATILHQHQPHFLCQATIVQPSPINTRDWIQRFIVEQLTMVDCIVVDTFPYGIFHELSDSLIRSASESILIGRYVKEEEYPNYDRGSQNYSQIFLPYHQDQCEWNTEKKGRYVGPIVRSISINSELCCDLVVLGNIDLIPKTWHRFFPRSTIYIDHYFESLPQSKRYFCIGAGYNLVWELNSLGLNVGHFPLEKRYDDQFRRAGMLGCMVNSRQALDEFLRSMR
jgi:hypothetical protein